MNSGKITNFLLAIITLFLGIIALKPIIVGKTYASETAWGIYVPIASDKGKTLFYNKDTGQIIRYSRQGNFVKDWGDLKRAKNLASPKRAMP